MSSIRVSLTETQRVLLLEAIEMLDLDYDGGHPENDELKAIMTKLRCSALQLDMFGPATEHVED